MHGSGDVVAAKGALTVPVRFPGTLGKPPGKTTPEELLAASHATCFGIGLRSVIGRRSGNASRVVVSVTVAPKKDSTGIRTTRRRQSFINLANAERQGRRVSQHAFFKMSDPLSKVVEEPGITRMQH
jgi:osmotically inducible protein OsmC